MLYSLLIAITGIVTIMLIWVGVQRIWGQAFAEHINDEDVLAERRSCGNCGCGAICKNKNDSSKTNTSAMAEQHYFE